MLPAAAYSDGSCAEAPGTVRALPATLWHPAADAEPQIGFEAWPHARAGLIALSDYVHERTRNTLDGLTGTEYLWEPVPSCWTIRRAGKYQADHSDSPGIPPFTTIAWRLRHLVECYGGIRNPQWLGVERQPAGYAIGNVEPRPT